MAQKTIINVGIEDPGVYLTTPATDGLPPDLSTFDYIGKIVPDSLARNDDEDSYATIKAQETNEILQELLQEEGTKRFNFSTFNFKTENLVRAMGGSVDTYGSWKAPTSPFRGDYYSMAYKSRADQETGLHTVIHYPYCKLKGKMEGNQNEGDGNKLNFEATIFVPVNASGVKQAPTVIQLIPAAPTNPVTDDTADTFDWDYVDGFGAYTDYEYSENGGTSYSDCTAKPQTVTSGVHAIGDIIVRVKEDTTSDTKHMAGFTLANTEAYT